MLSRIFDAARRFPHKTAYIYEEDFITYKELSESAERLAERLKGGTAPVIIYGHKSPGMIISILACLICERPYIPCDVCIPHERIRRIAEQSGADTLADCRSGIELIRLNGKGCNIPPHTAYIIFTSGSTGSPKGIYILRKSLERFISYGESVYRMNSSAVPGGHALFSFDLSVADIYLSLCGGRTFHAFDRVPPQDITALTCTPTFLRMCLLSGDFSPKNYPSLRTVLCCGEVLQKTTAEKFMTRFKGTRLINAYGPSECCCFVSAHDVTCEDITSPRSVPVGDTEHTASPVSIKNGEIFIGGISAAGGYLDGGGGFGDGGYYTGDSGNAAEGKLFFNGRINGGMIKYSGYRIELSEIEEAIRRAEGVADCTVSPVYDEKGQVTMLKAAVISDCDTGAAQIKNYLARHLPAYMIPKVIERTESLDVTPNGKASDGQ